MKIVSSKHNIVFLKCETQYEVTSTFLRLAEYYESPKFRAKTFDLEEYMDWYAERHGNFTYYSDWNGFNIPGEVVSRFFDGFENYLRKERDLYDLLFEFMDSDEKFYVIATSEESDSGTDDHEYAHAFFYMFPEYKKKMTKLVNDLPLKFKKAVFDELKEQGYCKQVFIDEAQAYLSTNTMVETDNQYEEYKTIIPWESILQFQKTFQEMKEEKMSDGE